MCKLHHEDVLLKLIGDAAGSIIDDIRASGGFARIWIVASNSLAAALVSLGWFISSLI